MDVWCAYISLILIRVHILYLILIVIMKQYELVCVIDGGLSSADATAVREKLEKHIPTIVATDDMGLMPLAYPLNGQDQAYFLSYHIEAPADSLVAIKAELKLIKGLAKYVFYVMKDGEEFLTFADLQKRYDTLVEDEMKRLGKDTVEELEDEEEETQED